MCKQITITYQGQGVSLNEYYSNKHWTHRKKIKDTYSKIFSGMMSELKGKIKFDQFTVFVFYNSRIDPDNVGGIEKIFTDTLRKNKLVIDDNKKYLKGVYFIPDESLPNGTYEFIVQDAATRDIASEMREWLNTRQYAI